MDGSVIAGKLSVNDLAIDTKFGSLKVPVEQIQSFMPGLGSHPDFQSKINQFISDLVPRLHRPRKGPGRPPENRPRSSHRARTSSPKSSKAKAPTACKSSSRISRPRPTTKTGPDSGGWVKDDVIVTPGFTVVGHITTPGFAVNTNFGTLNLKMEDIRQGSRDVVQNEDLRKTVAVNGTAFATRQFTNTSLKVSKGDKSKSPQRAALSCAWGGNQQSTPDGAQTSARCNPPAA